MQEIRTSVWCIIYNPMGLILVLKRSKKANNPGLFNLPGGGVDKGETPQHAIIREVREEAGIKLKTVAFTRVIIKDNKHMHFFSAKLNKEPTVKIDFESSTYKWLDSEAIKNIKLHTPTQLYFMG